jgi:hypothetical protein
MRTRFVATLKAHFDAHRRRAPSAFFWRVLLEWNVASILLLILISSFFDFTPRSDLDDMSATRLFVLACVIAPLLETLLLQSLPAMVARWFGAAFWPQIFILLIPFAAVHFLVSVVAGICAGIAGGFYLAFFYVHWRDISLGRAFFMTCAAHASYNFVIVAAVVSATAILERYGIT